MQKLTRARAIGLQTMQQAVIDDIMAALPNALIAGGGTDRFSKLLADYALRFILSACKLMLHIAALKLAYKAPNRYKASTSISGGERTSVCSDHPVAVEAHCCGP